MIINKVKSLTQGLETKKTSALKNTEGQVQNDKVYISQEAKSKVDSLKLQADVQEITKKTLSLSTDFDRSLKLKEIKEKLSRGEYDNPSLEMLNATADQLLMTLFDIKSL